MLKIAGWFLALSSVAAAQSQVQIDFGIRIGAIANDSFQAHQLCSGVGCVFGTRSFNSDKFRATLGPTVGVLLHDRAEIRFEAVRRRFGYQVQNDLVIPMMTQHSVEMVRGHFWEFPLLATYRFSYGAVRPFA